MCAIFGLIDYERVFSAHQREIILKVLSEECEVRGTDATGFAFNSGGKLKIFKRPFPAHEVSLNLRDDANVILGHTRMATQGDKQKIYINPLVKSITHILSRAIIRLHCTTLKRASTSTQAPTLYLKRLYTFSG